MREAQAARTHAIACGATAAGDAGAHGGRVCVCVCVHAAPVLACARMGVRTCACALALSHAAMRGGMPGSKLLDPYAACASNTSPQVWLVRHPARETPCS